jgi:uncharacterized protein YbjT (DUF2867 family)
MYVFIQTFSFFINQITNFMKYVITGATGNTGNPLASTLLQAGHEVVAIGRDSAKLAPLVAEGAIAAVGDLADVAFLTQAFAGADAVYALIPPRFDAPDFRAYQNQIAENLTQALLANQVGQVVTLSSFGAHRSDTGVLAGLYDFEHLLADKLPEANVLHLRAGFFLENFFSMIPVVQQAGVLGGMPLPADLLMAVVHTADIAAVAAQHLLALDFQGHGQVAVGAAQEVSMADAARILGAAIGKPDLTYVQFPPADFKANMMGMGASESLADAYLAFGEAAAKGYLSEGTDRSAAPTPTGLVEFAPVWAAAFQQALAQA